MTKKCTACAMTIPDEAKICPHCQTLQPQESSSSFGCLSIIGAIVVIIIVLSIIATCLSSEAEKATPQQLTNPEVKMQYPMTKEPISPTQAQSAIPVVPANSSEVKSNDQNPAKTNNKSKNTSTKNKDIANPKDKNNQEQLKKLKEEQKQKDRMEKARVKAEKQSRKQERKMERKAKRNNKQQTI